MYQLLFILVILPGFGNPEEECPEFIKCETSEKQSSCPGGYYYREKAKVHGCCPGCVRLKGPNDNCTSPAECQPGLTCDGVCKADPTQACEHYKRSDPIWNKTQYWKPRCNPDGTFAPKQCKGEKMRGKCFCVNQLGGRIFGEEEWSKAENMSCGCSRLLDEMAARSSDITLHCDHMGNFEPLQCDQKVCWCATPITGIPYTIAVPLEMMTSLPCYARDKVGVQYYRQCDSAKHMQEVAKALLSNHGTKIITVASQMCTFNGSFHRVQSLRDKMRCAFIDNSPLTELLPGKHTNCHCAYDRHVTQLHQSNFNFDCLPNGNYRSKQVWNEKVYCVDDDGFYYSDDEDDCSSQQFL